MSDIEFIDGLNAKAPNPDAPEYVKAKLSIKGEALISFLQKRDDEWINAEIKESSSYERLDRAALEYVLKCRYVPGKVGGVPREMWHEAPVNFVLQ